MMKFKTVVLCLKLLTCFILQRSFGNIVIKILSSMIKKWQVEKNQKAWYVPFYSETRTYYWLIYWILSILPNRISWFHSARYIVCILIKYCHPIFYSSFYSLSRNELSDNILHNQVFFIRFLFAVFILKPHVYLT